MIRTRVIFNGLQRGKDAGNFLTQKSCLPPWSCIGEIIVINTVFATIQHNEAITSVK